MVQQAAGGKGSSASSKADSKDLGTAVQIAARAVKHELQREMSYPAGVSSSPRRSVTQAGGPCVVVEFGLPETGGVDMEGIALHLKTALGASHSPATITCRTPSGSMLIYRWRSGMIVAQVPPAVTLRMQMVLLSAPSFLCSACQCGRFSCCAGQQLLTCATTLE